MKWDLRGYYNPGANPSELSLYIYLEWDLRGYYNPGANPSELYIYLEWDLWGYYNPGANPSELYIYLVWDLRGCYNPGANPSELYIYLKWDLWGYYNPVLTPVSSIYISGVRSAQGAETDVTQGLQSRLMLEFFQQHVCNLICSICILYIVHFTLDFERRFCILVSFINFCIFCNIL